jgi:hypothetical protein
MQRETAAASISLLIDDIDVTCVVAGFQQLDQFPGDHSATPEQPHLIPNTTRQRMVFE